MGVINPGIWESRLVVNVHHLCRGLQTVITAVLMVTSGPENTQNKWLLIMVFIHDDYDDIMIMFHDSIGSDISLSGFKWELKHNLIIKS